jgi:formamidopyrimidine-DNA glycosylase
MPELPEVEIYRRYFETNGVGRSVADVDVRDARILDEVTPRTFEKRMRERTFTATRRHGKHLFVATDGPWSLHLHFGMTGDLLAYQDPAAEPSYPKVVFRFDDGGYLAYDDARLFGLVGTLRDVDAFIEEKKLGIDPLAPQFTLKAFRELLRSRRGAVKPLLMGQRVVAGLGNLYVDEVLYRVGVAPLRSVESLSAAEVAALHRSIRKVLGDAIEINASGARYPKSFFLPHRGETEHCPRCGAVIRVEAIGGRTTYWCPGHQK